MEHNVELHRFLQFISLMASNSVFTYTCPYIRRCSVEATKSPYFLTVEYDAIIDACNDSQGRLLTVLEEAQKITPHHYLP